MRCGLWTGTDQAQGQGWHRDGRVVVLDELDEQGHVAKTFNAHAVGVLLSVKCPDEFTADDQANFPS